MPELMVVSNQWASRPDDQRYLTLEDMEAAVRSRKDMSREVRDDFANFELGWDPDDDVFVKAGGLQQAYLTNYSFGQFCSTVGVNGGTQYLRSLPPALAVPALQWTLEQRDGGLMKLLALSQDGVSGEVRAFTGPDYGRIWDADVVATVREMNHDDRWKVPAATYATSDPKRATTLYASDRDVFIFLCDPNSAIEINGEAMFRGFVVYNSETGNRSFGLLTFLYRRVCDNRIIWGASHINRLVLRHTLNGPRRFAEKAIPLLQQYNTESATPIIERVKAAKEMKVGKDSKSVAEWLAKRGFTKTEAKVAVERAEIEEGDPTNLWSVVQGLTSMAKAKKHSDDRFEFEKKASDLLDLVPESDGKSIVYMSR